MSDIVREGGIQRLLDADLIVQASKDCAQKTLKRLEDKMHGKVGTVISRHLKTRRQEDCAFCVSATASFELLKIGTVKRFGAP